MANEINPGKKTIYVGAGHSSNDPGAVVDAFTEAGLVTELRDLVADEARTAGANVITDGTGDVNLPLGRSIELAKSCDGPRIELHLNSASPEAHGTECLSLEELKPLAQTVASAISGVLKTTLRGDGKDGWKSDTEGQHHRLGFCREGGGVVVECFFLTNANELEKYLGNKVAVAKAIAEALLES